MTTDRRILIISGPNGAGKTSFATEFLPNEADCPNFVNADLIAAGLSPFRADLVGFQAGRLMLKQIHEHARRGDSFAFETTLSRVGYARWIPRWQTQGYRVKLFFLRLPTPEAAIGRVAQRVSEGGHAVPESVSADASIPGETTSSASTEGSSTNGRSTAIRETHRSCWRKGDVSEFSESESDTSTTRS